MKTKFIKFSVVAFFVLFIVAGLFPPLVHADPPDELDYGESYNRAKVLQVVNENLKEFEKTKTFNETMKVQFLEGTEKNKIVTVNYATDATFGTQQAIEKGTTVIVDSKPDATGKMYYTIYAPYRLTMLWWFLGGLVLLILAVVGKKGIGALIGLAISVMVIVWFIIPQILAGADPLTICISGGIVILLLTTYIAHGISLKTTVALIGTSLSLIIAGFLSVLSVHLAYLVGINNNSSDYIMQLTAQHLVNPQGLLLGGILIGTLGALNDITTTQAVTVFAFAKENPKQKLSHLFWKSLHIGREHIISMINTLVLAYAGSSFAVLLYFSFNPAHLPWWMLVNDETVMEEIIRTLIGSAALILAVPITTFLASWISLKKIKIVWS